MVLNGRWTISTTIFTIFNKDINSQWTWKTLPWLLLLALFLPAWWRDPNDDSTRRGALAECTFGFCALRHGLAWIRVKPQNYKAWASRSSPSDAFRLKCQLVTVQAFTSRWNSKTCLNQWHSLLLVCPPAKGKFTAQTLCGLRPRVPCSHRLLTRA